MKITSVLATIIVSLVLQLAVARYTVGGRWQIDLVLVGVVYAAVYWGPVAGLLGGTAGGLIQDLLSHGVVGVGGLAKTLVGFAAGTIAAQFIVARPQSRTMVVALASLVHRGLMLVLYALIDQHWPAVSLTAILGETVLNAAAGLLAFQLSDSLPGAFMRGRQSRRSTLSRRQW